MSAKKPSKDHKADLGPSLDKVLVGDARLLSRELPTGSIDVTITSPPYFDMKDYGRANQIGYGQDYANYLKDLTNVFSEVHRATRATGSLWIIIDTFRKGQEVVPLPFDLANHLKAAGWILRDIVIWKKDRTVPWRAQGATRRIFEYILIFSRSAGSFRYDHEKFRDTVDIKKWWVRYPERYNPKGKAAEEIWSYSIPTQGSWGDRYIGHFCPLPSDLVSRIVQMTTDVRDVVLDPFSGSGTVPTVSKLLDRHFVGFELNRSYVTRFEKHLKSELEKQRQLSLIPQSPRHEEDFRNTIISLRILKYGRLLLRALKKEFLEKHITVLAFRSARKTSEPHKIVCAEYVVYSKSKSVLSKVQLLVKEITERPPFSKFGIQPTLLFAHDSSELEEKRRVATYFLYTSTNSHHYSGKLLTADEVFKIDGILCSPIGVQVEEPDA
ncbi:DNA-methyltransferase [Variovorax sp. VNK109]|uniref:DNA-methyltransferase n=1 Tax=Variovorax sp. VNK109 TaxID=3400919 RepID=UPI003C020341